MAALRQRSSRLRARGRWSSGEPRPASMRRLAPPSGPPRQATSCSSNPENTPSCVVLKDGVDLIARVPGTVTLVAPSGYAGWTSITADGRLGNRISGIRLLGRATAPISVGLRLTGHDVLVDDVTIEGAVLLGVDVANEWRDRGPRVPLCRCAGRADAHRPRRAAGSPAERVRPQGVRRNGCGDRSGELRLTAGDRPICSSDTPTPCNGPAAGPQVLRDNFFIRGTTNGR